MSEQNGDNGGDLFCPADATLDLLSHRGAMHVLRSLLTGTRRFNEIAREKHLNPSTLRERLRELEDQGVVERTVVSAMPPNVEYKLTPKGQALSGVFESLDAWGRAWMHKQTR